MLQKALRVLSLPFPLKESLNSKLGLPLLFGLFVFLFLFVFQPFGLSEVPFPKDLISSLLYGGITTAVMLINYFLLPPILPGFFNEKRWTVARELISSAWNIVSIAIANLMLSNLLGFANLKATAFLWAVMVTLAVGIIPVSIMMLISYNLELRKHQKEAREFKREFEKKSLDKYGEDSDLIIQEGQKTHKFKSANICFIEADGNYSKFYIREKDRTDVKLIRASLSNIQEKLKADKEFTRVHRSFIVNLKYVKSAKGNALGMNLELDGLDDTIPVSRKNVSLLRDALEV